MAEEWRCCSWWKTKTTGRHSYHPPFHWQRTRRGGPELVQVNAKVPVEVLERLEKRAKTMSEQMGNGITISVSAVVRSILIEHA